MRLDADALARTFADVAARHDRCAWLDGGGARDWSGRRSILAWCEPDDVSLTYDAGRREVLRHRDGRAEVVGDDPFVVLQAELDAGPRDAHWLGWFGYASRPDLPARVPTSEDAAHVPDAVWMRPSHLRLVDHLPDEQRAVPPEPARPKPAPPGSAHEAPPAGYRRAFAQVQERLHAGDTYEVNLTMRLRAAADLDPASAYLRLRALNPAPYAGFLQHRSPVPGATGWLLSSSPERYALIGPEDPAAPDGPRRLETKPIKGTLPRLAEPDADASQRERLRSAPRFRAENLMIVDLLRNDLSLVCEPGTVEVPALMQVETYATVHQLVSTVRGRLRRDVPTVAALRALFPAGSMTGAPKLRTMSVIAEVEADPRGVYSGAFGWIGADGRADLGVVIRSLTTAGDGTWQVGTGGGVTVLSEVADEHAEALLKAARVLRVLDDA
ncbi:anthranilate synthase component I family protein [Nocardioides sp. TRM66260-LWL]|uniref:anthranilate synthase component I family protein n=1 Tax=Nocardioides sp. TRM66260-LWL TaxID=2874478 RepID=UPI001CC72BA4|nr:anthranilate synthase component I family protein [Nocardioides sp. TRM66260-LWL]MBZ5735992.1 anthranilate synthase component I family protein [Nocardioides sp. TRM66260-LWL]